MASAKPQSSDDLKAARSFAKTNVTTKVNRLHELLSAREPADAIQRVQIELTEVLQEFKSAHEAYHSQIKTERERQESEKYYDLLVELASELEREISSWITQPDAQRLLTAQSTYVAPEDSVSNAGSRNSFHTRSAIGSCTSSTASARARSAAKKAALEAKAATLQKLHDLEIEELRIKQRKAEVQLQADIAEAEAERRVFEEAEAEETQERDLFHRDEVTPVRVALKTVKSASTPMEGGLPGNITDEIAISPQGKQPYQQSETPRPSKYPLNPEAPEYRHTRTPNQEGSPHDVKISRDQDTSFVRLMETQDRHNQALMELVRHQQQSTAALTLPQPSMQVFSGDPIDYCDFIHAFEHLVEQKTTSSSSRLYYLVQYTSGPAQELMRSCLSMREEEGYVEARRLLKERYGRSYKIAAAHVKRLIDGPSIKPEDGSALEQFSIQLSSCVNTLKEIGYVNKLDNPDNLKKIIDRLPFGIRLKWRDAVDRIIENENRDVTVKDIMDFVAAKARAATHPIFGKVLNENKGKQVNGKPLRKPLRGGGFSTQGTSPPAKNFKGKTQVSFLFF